ncbi:hypothetical protein NA57DRAFT_75849 [Rhizodiscina lignyota]|uniref:Heterokaryon incompatibility domain-containing protein n=1 Tax=Rhizodiscina lignyota TaxID=1504668 RepID=A0A9P4II41_9PEZI|nr:hypothetical protein NA57DRAFT_75849 [Rhizodiscina lignyota]
MNLHHERYEAVSYAWGQPEFSKALFCDGSACMNITPPVDLFLRYLRKQYTKRALWIDSVSINQSDEKEKSIQVLNMGGIFCHSRKVHIWLGESSQHTSTFFMALEALERYGMDKSMKQYILNGSAHTAIVSETGRLLSVPWFERRWILQEVALGHDIIIHCGQLKMKWTIFGAGLNHIKDLSLDPQKRGVLG